MQLCKPSVVLIRFQEVSTATCCPQESKSAHLEDSPILQEKGGGVEVGGLILWQWGSVSLAWIAI